MAANIKRQLAKTPYGDPISGFTLSNATTGDTIAGQAVYGSGGDYQVAYYKSSSASTSPAAGYVLGSPLSDPTLAKSEVITQPWPSNDAAYNSSPIYPSSGSHCEGYNTGSCANTPVTQTTTIAFNKAGYHPYGVETQIGTSAPTGTAYSSYSKVLYAANGSAGTITKIDPAKNTAVGSISVAGTPTAVAVNPTNGFIYVANAATNKLQVINPTTNAIFEIGVGTNPTGLSVSSDGKKIFVANSGSGTVTMVDSGGSTPTNASAYKAVTLQTGGGQGTSGVAVAPSSDPSDGYTVFATNTISNTVSVINTDTKETSTITGFDAPKGVVTSPEGKYIYVSNSGTNTVSVIASITGQTLPKAEVSSPAHIALSTDGRWAYVTSTTNDTVTVINTADNTVVQT
ncbi:MAG: YncE family protein, partial [Planctomycetota bacterium]